MLAFGSQTVRADEQKLSCTFTMDVPGLGYLEGGSEANVNRSVCASGSMLIFRYNKTQK